MKNKILIRIALIILNMVDERKIKHKISWRYYLRNIEDYLNES